MGLITKTVIVKWRKDNKEWYEQKGYIFTNYGNQFEVKTKDLTSGSHIKVEIKCDNPNCESPYLKPMTYGNYSQFVHSDDIYYCRKCAKKLFGTKNMIKTKLLNSKSFEQWCIKNNRQDVLDRWNYELNDKKPNEILYRAKEKYYFRCNKNHEHHSELKSLDNFTGGSEGSIDCIQCNSFAQYLIDNYGENALDLYWDYAKNTVYIWNINKCSSKKVWIKCQEKDYHGSYLITCSNFYMGYKCPYCCNYHGRVHPLDSLGQYIINSYGEDFLNKIWSEKNIKSPYEYTPHSRQKIWWKCENNEHEDYKRSIKDSNNYNFRCPECVYERNESFLQEKVRLYLQSLNNGKYTILHENKCTIIPINPKNNHRMPFDNEIKEIKLICEVNGKQHYKISNYTLLLAKDNNTTSKYELHMQQVRDRYKKFIAYKQGYNYIAIPYWTDDKDETWKKLIDDKIKEVI